MQDKQLRIIIIGAGLIGPRHAQSILKNPHTTLTALVDPSPAASSIAQSLNTSYYPSLEALLQVLPPPDGAIVCTPNHTHVAIAKDLLAAGIHVLLEKPISEDIASGQSLLDVLGREENKHLKLLVGHHRRFNPFVRRTKELLEEGALGNVIAVNGLWMLCKPDGYFEGVGEWRRQKSAGVIPINLVHDLDILHFLFGPITRIHAERTLPQRANPPHEAEEGAALTLRFKSGVVGTFLVCDAAPSPFNFEAGTGENPLIPREGRDFYRIFGSRASLSVPDMTRWSYDGGERSWNEKLEVSRFEVEEATPFDLQVEHFVEVVAGRSEPSCDGEDALRALVACEAVKRAIETGETVDLD